MNSEHWTQAEAEGYAATYASTYPALRDELRKLEELRDALRDYMQRTKTRDLADGETGLGVHLDQPSTQTTWDVRSMPGALVLTLKDRGVLTIATAAFDALRRAGGGPDLDDADRYRIRGAKSPSVRVMEIK